MTDKVEMKLPSRPEHISLIRLVASSLANNMDFNIEEIEDIKVCISEACTNVLNFSDEDEIEVEFHLIEDQFCVEIKNVLEEIPDNLENAKQGQMGLLIINSLMDEVEFDNSNMTMVKFK